MHLHKEIVYYLTEKEEALVTALIKLGMKKKTALLLVYLAERPEATSRDIERGTDLRQPEVSLALKDLLLMGWIQTREDESEHKGRPRKLYGLSLPLSDIMNDIVQQKNNEVKQQLALIKKIQEYV